MFDQMKILGVIAARGGSKGVPRKNVRRAGGKPLIAWMIEAAGRSRLMDRLILSSDDSEIIRVAGQYGCEAPFVRPAHLARDESSVSDVIVHAMESVPGYDFVMLLQPTSPLTRAEDIDGCIESCINSSSDAMVSVTQVDKSPYWMFHMDGTAMLKPVLGERYLNKRRQDLPVSYLPSGAIYMARSSWFMANRSFYSDTTRGYVVPAERSLDIDTESDLRYFDWITKANRQK
ncbi:MAG: acylneuraminate cytidylyltransferase family protein [Desulfobacter sp.]|nr:MAG: acylneuraminate cytidylyltransferase family protein [Desulfobacter sp.]